MTPFDAWVVRRIRSGLPVTDDQRQAVSAPFRAIVDKMAPENEHDRGVLWDAFVNRQPDADAIRQALLAVDPLADAPEVSEDEPGSDWPAIKLANPSDVLPFPIDVLPEAAVRLVREGAESIGCPPDYFALPVLVAAAGVIGQSVSLRLKPNYFARASLWGAVVATPSDGKSPALKIVAGAVRRIDASLAVEHRQAVDRWEASAAEASAAKGKPPMKPRPRRIDVDDITMEALIIALADNHRGLIIINDELSAFVSGMDQYKGGKGSDRSVALKLWAGDAVKRDRVLAIGDGPIRCPHPCLSLIGGLTPDMLGSLLDAKGRKDGFIDRFLVVDPDAMPAPGWSDRGVSDETTDQWSTIVARLWERTMRQAPDQPEAVPHVATFTPEGKALWVERFNAHRAEMNDDQFPAADLKTVWGKLGEYAGRLALVLACLWHADDSTLDPTAVPLVDARIVHDAWRLIDYFKSHARRVHATIARGSGIGGSPTVQAVLKWIQSDDRTMFTVRDLKRARTWIDADELDKALLYLANRHVIRPVEAPDAKPSRGRPASPVYEVNPSLAICQK